MAPKRPQDAPKTAPGRSEDASKTFPRCSKTLLDLPDAPKPPQITPRRALTTQNYPKNHPQAHDFETIFLKFWKLLRNSLGTFAVQIQGPKNGKQKTSKPTAKRGKTTAKNQHKKRNKPSWERNRSKNDPSSKYYLYCVLASFYAMLKGVGTQIRKPNQF